jgi:hypothetical protein
MDLTCAQEITEREHNRCGGLAISFTLGGEGGGA